MADEAAASEIIEHRRVRQRRSPQRSRIGLNITAMIDVVFLLLIYFMAATNFKLGEEVFRMDLPQRGRTIAADPFQIDVEPLRIAVSSVDRERYHLQIHGPLSYEPASFDDLFRFLDQRRAGAGPSGLFEKDHPLIVEPAGSAQWEHAIGAFNAAVRAQYTNVSFQSAG